MLRFFYLDNCSLSNLCIYLKNLNKIYKDNKTIKNEALYLIPIYDIFYTLHNYK